MRRGDGGGCSPPPVLHTASGRSADWLSEGLSDRAAWDAAKSAADHLDAIEGVRLAREALAALDRGDIDLFDAACGLAHAGLLARRSTLTQRWKWPA